MAIQIKWNRKALKQFDGAIDYGYKNFGKLVTQKFYERVMSYESLLAHNPEMGIVEIYLSHRNIAYRSLVVHKYFKLVYYIKPNKDELHIAAFWDTRREPQQLIKSI